MPGIGTIVNVAAVILGGIIGMLFGKKIKLEIRDSLMKTAGVAVIFIGAVGALSGLLKVSSNANGSLETYGSLMMIISLIVGTLIGELIKIEKKLDRFGEWLKIKAKATEDGGFVGAFVNTSLVICVGAMAVVGAIEDGIGGNPTTLFAKALLDFLIVIIMTSTLGKGCIFAFIPIGIFQGSITALSKFAEPLLSMGSVISDMSLVGSVLIFCVGINLCFGKKFNVGNMLPSLIVAIIYSVIQFYI
ncbi:MAG: DUF554 domain-containing protein [Clostridia bacterium]|nr:DUF554 domain-containing protein [Clostridia bacterium]